MARIVSNCEKIQEDFNVGNCGCNDMSRPRIGLQSLANLVGLISKKMKFDWC